MKGSWDGREYPGLPRWAQCNHKDPYKREAWDGQSGRRHDDESRSQRDLKTLYFWFWRQRKKPWANKCRCPLESRKGKETFSPRTSRRSQSADTLTLAQRHPFQTSYLQNWKILHMCCFKPLNWLPCWPVGRQSAPNAGDVGSIPGLGRSLGEGNGKPLQHSCQENSMDRGAWLLQSMGSQRVRHSLATEQQQSHWISGTLWYQQ